MFSKNILFLVVCLAASAASVADIIPCNTKTSFSIVEANRKSDPRYTDLFLIRFLDEAGAEKKCSNISYAYIENTAGSHDSIVSMAFMLSAQEKMATIMIDTEDMKGSAARIEYMYPKQ